MSTEKKLFRTYCEAWRHPQTDFGAASVSAFFAPNADINVVHPFNAISGGQAYLDQFLIPLHEAFDHLYRTDTIAFAGGGEGDQWVTSTGYYCGHFARPFAGIPPTGALAFLRFGEFHKIANGRAVESYIFLDLPELMIAAGVWPIRSSPGRDRGYMGLLPGPARPDGLIWGQSDPARSASSLQMVTDMLRGLATPDEAWRPYWHDNMMWYGPAAFGSFVGLENFAGFQVPFEKAFQDWAGGASGNGRTRHFARFADGDYICSGGWPSLSGVQVGPFLDQPASGKMLYMRVCDWWRREGDVLTENWVFVDIPHVLLQLGVDVLRDHSEMAEASRAEMLAK